MKELVERTGKPANERRAIQRLSLAVEMKEGHYEKQDPIDNDVDVFGAVSWGVLFRSWRLWLEWSPPRP